MNRHVNMWEVCTIEVRVGARTSRRLLLWCLALTSAVSIQAYIHSFAMQIGIFSFPRSDGLPISPIILRSRLGKTVSFCTTSALSGIVAGSLYSSQVKILIDTICHKRKKVPAQYL